jgi:hypothetical protein
LFSHDWDKTLSVWDLATGEERRIKVERDLEMIGDGGMVVSSDGKTLVMVDPKQTIRILDAATGEERQHFQGLRRMLGMGLTPDGRSLVGWSVDLKVRVWDTTTGRKLREYPLPQFEGGNRDPRTFYEAALSPDGRVLAVGRLNYPLIFKDLTTGRDVPHRDKLPSEVNTLAFSPDGRMLAWSAYGNTDPSIHLLEVSSGRERRRLKGHRGWVIALTFSAAGDRLISGSMDTTALVWDLGSRFDPRKAPTTLTAAQVESLWTDLAGEDAARAYQAIRKLAASPTLSIPLLRKRLHPVAVVDEKRQARLIADLDSDDFPTRQKASVELERLGGLPLSAYCKALEGKPSPEMRRRLQEWLEKAGPAWWDVSGERLRSLRAVETLELAGTKEAREVLETLAGGAEGSRLTEQAKAALQRLTKPARK